MTAAQSAPCTAHSSRTGKPCRLRAVIGMTVCRTHGGAAPQVKRAAAERLAELVDPAIDTLNDLLDSNRDDVRLGAARDVLDRTGHKAPEKIDVSASVEHKAVVDDASAQLLADLIAAGLAHSHARTTPPSG